MANWREVAFNLGRMAARTDKIGWIMRGTECAKVGAAHPAGSWGEMPAQDQAMASYEYLKGYESGEVNVHKR